MSETRPRSDPHALLWRKTAGPAGKRHHVVANSESGLAELKPVPHKHIPLGGGEGVFKTRSKTVQRTQTSPDPELKRGPVAESSLYSGEGRGGEIYLY